MFSRILLPLDGSDNAEVVIPFAVEMSRVMDSELILFHACDKSHRQAHRMHKLYLERLTELLLENQGQEDASAKQKIRMEHKFGDFLPTIQDSIYENKIDLVVMVAHGFSSLDVPLSDSVVDDVIRIADCPTILVRPKNSPDSLNRSIHKILIPLDGSPYSQQILSIAKPIAEKFDAEVVLISCVMVKGDSTEQIENEKDTLINYLEGVQRLFAGIKVSIFVTESTDFGITIDEIALQEDVDIVMMATNSPVNEWAENSLSRKMLRRGATSLLVMHRH